MTRDDFRKLSRQRLKEAKTLLDNRHYSGAYYLAGYAVEFALKAIIASKTKNNDFPDKNKVNRAYTHQLEELYALTELREAVKEKPDYATKFAPGWSVIIKWNENSRYQSKGQADANELIKAITQRNGVMQCLREHW